jgi:hypothetical protein
MLKVRHYFIILILTFPILVSFDPNGLPRQSFALYESPEGIQFISYSKEWDQQKLEELYKELLQNKHGKELNYLQEVRVIDGALSSSLTKGSYHALTNTITLYQGGKYTEASEYRETLSHEYGHHFAYYYFPSHHFPFSEWQQLRGISTTDLRWDAFWNYKEKNHAFYPQEVIADDYVLLYGATKKLDVNNIESNEVFYLRTEHENQELPNVLENTDLQLFLEEGSGIKINEDRLLQSPKLLKWSDETLLFQISTKSNVAYRLNLAFHDSFNSTLNSEVVEVYEITSGKTNGHLEFSLDQINQEIFSKYEYVSTTIDVVDLSTAIGFQTEEKTLKLNN